MREPAREAGAERVSAKPRVVIVDDHHLFRSGVRAELGAELRWWAMRAPSRMRLR